MKKDIKTLLKYLQEFTDTFSHSEIILNTEKEDAKMHLKIREIKNKYKF